MALWATLRSLDDMSGSSTCSPLRGQCCTEQKGGIGLQNFSKPRLCRFCGQKSPVPPVRNKFSEKPISAGLMDFPPFSHFDKHLLE
jgi:hypothetical protein